MASHSHMIDAIERNKLWSFYHQHSRERQTIKEDVRGTADGIPVLGNFISGSLLNEINEREELNHRCLIYKIPAPNR
ncbi:hypothetical protein HNY73_013457 [Argiope bruennichi]|uniref:Uncharacterized protein n=1 Tax=Argiope bruennichi TaxID=94029 RepID=A0A8T0F429_ARGBR|nr:hypothetical protein HNY73_013457 [Argiope bruennichi]